MTRSVRRRTQARNRASRPSDSAPARPIGLVRPPPPGRPARARLPARARSAGGAVAAGLALVDTRERPPRQRRRGDAVVDVALDVGTALLRRAVDDELVDHRVRDL